MKKKASTDLINKNTVSEEFLEFKRKLIFCLFRFSIIMQKKWGDKLTGYKCFMLYPRSLYFTWGNREYWTCFEETG
ncbi:hypothetical protein CFP56_020990 [Quercus suber]|uniref:Uncharacterized protein n=1 Tax=Quercus suber TaxID=58331 RepID=A0AAW0M029_QUESU